MHLEKLIPSGIYRSPSEHKKLLSWISDQLLGPKRPIWIPNPDPTRGALYDDYSGKLITDCYNVYLSPQSLAKNAKQDLYTSRDFTSSFFEEKRREGSATVIGPGIHELIFMCHSSTGNLALHLSDGRRFRIWIRSTEYSCISSQRLDFQFIGEQE